MLSVSDLLKALEGTAVAVFVQQSVFGFAALDMVHVAAIAMVFGMILFLDLRLIGVAAIERAVTELAREVLPWIWGAFAVAMVSGGLMFTGQAVKYAGNHAFRMKLALLVVAGINMLVFHVVTYRGVAVWDRAAVPLAGRVAGAISLLCWAAILAYGRFTAYFMYP